MYRIFIAILFALPILLAAGTGELRFRDFGARGDGVADDGEAFSKVFAALKAAPGATLVIPRGTYRIGSGAEKYCHERYHRIVRGLENNTVSGEEGASIVFTDPDHGGFLFMSCRGLKLRGLTFDWDPLPFTQGEITAVNAEDPRMFTLKIEPGYPEADNKNFTNYAPEGKFMIGFVYDPATRRLFSGKFFDNHKNVRTVERIEHGLYRITLSPNSSPDAVEKGRLFVLISRNPSNGLVFDNCENPKVEDVTMYSSSHIGMVFRAGTSRPETRRVNLVRKPGTTRMLCTNADGLFFDGCAGGPVVEHCHLDGVMDDGIVLPVNSRTVLAKVDDSTFEVGCTWATPIRPGNRLEAIDKDGSRTGVLPPIAAVSRDRVEKIAGRNRHLETVRFSAPPAGLAVGMQLFNLDMANGGFTVRGNTVENLRGKGIKIHGIGGVAENNHISGTTFGGIEIGYQFANGVWSYMWADDVVVRDNLIDRAAMLGLIQPTPVGWATAIRVHQGRDDFRFRPNRNIAISGNTITDSGQSAIRAWATENLTITGNTIRNFNLMAFPSETMAIELINVGNAVVTDNTVATERNLVK